jgi:hypothetical protein
LKVCSIEKSYYIYQCDIRIETHFPVKDYSFIRFWCPFRSVNNFEFKLRGVRTGVRAEWLRLWSSDHLPSPLLVRIPTETLDSFIWGSYPDTLWNVGGSTQVPVCAWNIARKDTGGLPPTVKLESRLMISILYWCVIKPNHEKVFVFLERYDIGTYICVTINISTQTHVLIMPLQIPSITSIIM